MSGKTEKWLDRVESWGNALPDPVFLFLGLIAALVGVSVAAALLGWSAVNPVSGETLTAQSLLSAENVGKLMTTMAEQIGRATLRDIVVEYVSLSVVAQ